MRNRKKKSRRWREENLAPIYKLNVEQTISRAHFDFTVAVAIMNLTMDVVNGIAVASVMTVLLCIALSCCRPATTIVYAQSSSHSNSNSYTPPQSTTNPKSDTYTMPLYSQLQWQAYMERIIIIIYGADNDYRVKYSPASNRKFEDTNY